MDRVAEIGEAEVKRRLDSGASAAEIQPHVVGRTSSLTGRRWAVTARVSVSTAGLGRAEAVRRQAIAAGRHDPNPRGTTRGAEGETHAFRDARSSIMTAARENAHLLLEDLT